MRVLAFLLLATAACAQTTFPAWVFQKKTSASSASVPVVISGQNNKVFGLDGSGNLALLTNGSGSSTLAGLSDVAITGIANEDLLRYDTNESKWLNISSETLLGAPVIALRDLADGAGALTNDGAGVLSWVSYQPLDSDLTGIAALATHSYGRGVLQITSSGNMKTYLGLLSSPGGDGANDDGKYATFANGGSLTASGFYVFNGTGDTLLGTLSDANHAINLPDGDGTLLLANGSGASLTALNASNIASGTLSVSHGGTGSTSLTANNVLLGNGTSALQAVAPGTSGNVLTSNGTTWTSAAPAAGASPGGSGSEIQYRSGASTFGAVTGSSVSGATLSLAGKLTVDGSADVAQLVIQGHSTQTSALQEWQNSGGTQVAKVNNSGTLFAVPSGGGFLMKRNDSSDNNTGVYSPDTVTVGFATANTAVFYASSNYGAQLHSSGYLGISTTPHVGGTADVRLYRDDAGVLALRNSTTPQTVRVYETDSGSNDEYVEINAASGTNYIKPAATGTGTASKLDHYVTSSVFITSGAGSPEAAVTAPVGSLFIRTDGGASTTLYVKESGSGNTGWVAK